MKVDVTTLAAKKAGTVDLADEVFALEPRGDILHRMVAWQLAKRQAGTHKTKGRSEISLTGKKFVKQKGSGRRPPRRSQGLPSSAVAARLSGRSCGAMLSACRRRFAPWR